MICVGVIAVVAVVEVVVVATADAAAAHAVAATAGAAAAVATDTAEEAAAPQGGAAEAEAVTGTEEEAVVHQGDVRRPHSADPGPEAGARPPGGAEAEVQREGAEAPPERVAAAARARSKATEMAGELRFADLCLLCVNDVLLVFSGRSGSPARRSRSRSGSRN